MTTDSASATNETLQKSTDFASVLSSLGVRYVRIEWVDLCNNVCSRIFPASYFLKILESKRPGITMAKVTLGLGIVGFATGFSAVGEHILVVDLSSFRPCSYAPGHAVVYGFVQEQEPVPSPSGPSFDVLFCPRTIVARLIRYASEELGIKFLVGFETEFTLVKSANPLVLVNNAEWTAQLAITSGTIESQVMEEIADGIQADGIELQVYHKEGAPGQFEVATGPLPPLEAADALVHTRQIIRNIASKHGVKATFSPSLGLDSCGTGTHLHVSVRSERDKFDTFDLLTGVETTFLSGLLGHLPSIVALTLPLPVSYARMKDGIWSGGTWVCWGVDNREAPIRLTKVKSTSRNFEVRCVDGTSNPYLAVAGVLACGIVGARDKLALAVQNCDKSKTAAEMSDEERTTLGIMKRLPLNIEEARKYLAADEAIKEVLGTEFVERYLSANKMLGRAMGRREGETDAETVARLIENF